MTEAPEPTWDRIASDSYICALGRVVYEANRLEAVAANKWYTWAHMAGEKPHLKHRSMGQAMTRMAPTGDLIRILTRAEPKTDRIRKDLGWAEETRRLLQLRHEVTHVRYVHFDDPQVLAMYVNKDGSSVALTELDDPAPLLQIAAEMLAHRKAGERPDYLDVEDPGRQELGQDPERGLSWITLMPGHNPFAKDQPSG